MYKDETRLASSHQTGSLVAVGEEVCARTDDAGRQRLCSAACAARFSGPSEHGS